MPEENNHSFNFTSQMNSKNFSPRPLKEGEHGRDLLIGVLLEKRPNLHGTYPCAIGGFTEPEVDHEDTALDEAHEEADLKLEKVQLVELPGVAVAPNRGMNVVDIPGGEGTKIYGLKVDHSELDEEMEILQLQINGAMTMAAPAKKLRSDSKYLDPIKEGKRNNLYFLLEHIASITSPDALVGMGIARIRAHVYMTALQKRGQ